MDDLPAGQLKLVEAGGTRVVLARVRDEVFACSDECAHQGGPLSEGRLSGARLACPWHGWMYDVRSGECVMPARGARVARDRKSTRLNSSHGYISYAVFCLKKKKHTRRQSRPYHKLAPVTCRAA